MQDEESVSRPTPSPPDIVISTETDNIADEERAFTRLTSFAKNADGNATTNHSRTPTAEEETELQTRPNSISDTAAASSNPIKRKVSQLWDILSVSGSQATSRPLNPKLAALVSTYASSDIAASIRAEVAEFSEPGPGSSTPNGQNGSALPDVEGEIKGMKGRSRASWGTQFRILSGRAFKNLYRDPALLTAHYVSSIIIACEWKERTVREWKTEPSSLQCSVEGCSGT